jgi:hypothetical protein
MTNFSMFMKQFNLSFENKPIDNNNIPVPINNAKFGILSLEAEPCDINTQEQDFIFTIDRSGSMSDKCSDGRNKMQHIIHTLKNMILYFFENPNINAYISVFSFDDTCICVIERTKVTVINIQQVLLKVENIYPLGCTNIELALKNLSTYVESIKTSNPSNNISNIFMTDGEATAGSKNLTTLKSLVNSDIDNAFIGVGIDHDVILLEHISSHKNSSYHFIDALEKSGLVYGEILHNILYKHLIDTQITIENGLIYDYFNNQWVNNLFIGTVVGEANKTFHIVSDNPDTCKIILNCKNNDNNLLFQANTINNPDTDHSIYLFRQRTLQILFNVKEVQSKIFNAREDTTGFRVFNRENKFNFNNSKISETKMREVKLKDQLRLFLDEIKKYMSDNDLNDNKILKNLCDDVYICYKTIGTKYGKMYTTARQVSQATQRCYTVSNTPGPEEDNMFYTSFGAPSIFRNFCVPNDTLQQTEEVKDPLEVRHDVSLFEDLPYLTPLATRLMRDISSSTDEQINDFKI